MSTDTVPARKKNGPPPPAEQREAISRGSEPARELVNYLQETGSPGKLLRYLERWLGQDEQRNATAEELFRHLEGIEAKDGTLRKAGRWVYGPTFEPARIVEQAPADELLRLRSENDRYLHTIEDLRADKLGLTGEVNYLRKQVAELTDKVRFLSLGRSQTDLHMAGVKPAEVG